MLWADKLAGGVHQQQGALLLNPFIAAYVYMGIKFHSTINLKFVTSTHTQVSKYTNPRTKLPHKGVAKDEYADVLCDHLILEGITLFQHAGN